jgi:hypothetical protein
MSKKRKKSLGKLCPVHKDPRCYCEPIRKIEYVCMGCLVGCRCSIDEACGFTPDRCLDEKINLMYEPDWREI